MKGVARIRVAPHSLLQRNAQLLSGLHPRGDLHSPPIEAHLALSNHGVNPAFGDILEKSQQQIVDPLAPFPGLNLVEPGAVALTAPGMIVFPF